MVRCEQPLGESAAAAQRVPDEKHRLAKPVEEGTAAESLLNVADGMDEGALAVEARRVCLQIDPRGEAAARLAVQPGRTSLEEGKVVIRGVADSSQGTDEPVDAGARSLTQLSVDGDG